MNNPRVNITRFLHEDLVDLRAHFYVNERVHIRLLDVNSERLAFRADFGSSPDARGLAQRLAATLLVRYGDAIAPMRLGVAVGEPGMVCPGARPAWPGITYVSYADRLAGSEPIEAEPELIRRFDNPADEVRATIRDLWTAAAADGWSDPEGPDGMWFAGRAFSEDRGFDWLLSSIEQRIAEREAKERKEKGGLRWLRAKA